MAAAVAATSSTAATPSARPKGWLHFAAGGVGGMCGAIVTSPLDVVKTRLQSDLYKAKAGAAPAATAASQGAVAATKRLAYHFIETGHLLGDIATKEGPRALFKGLGPTLVGAVPARAINFYTYGNGKVILAETFNDGKESSLVHLGAAASAGIVTATATNPIWVVKTRLQLDAHQIDAARANTRAAAVASRVAATAAAASTSSSSTSSRPLSTTATSTPPLQKTYFRPTSPPRVPGPSSIEMTLRIVRTEGVKGLYKGMSASYLGVAEGTIQWVLYERLKKWGAVSSDVAGGETKQQGWATTVGAAGSAKMVASLITYPHEVVRTRMRQQPEPGQKPRYTGLLQTVKLVWREEGAASLYGGLSAHLLRVVPNAAIMFSVYELALYLGARAAQAEQRKAQSTALHV